MLSALLYNAFNNGSRGFVLSSQLPECLLLFWVAYFLAPVHAMNSSVWLCAAKPNSNSEAQFSVWMVFLSFWLCTGNSHYWASRLVGKKVVTNITSTACMLEQVINNETMWGSHFICFLYLICWNTLFTPVFDVCDMGVALFRPLLLVKKINKSGNDIFLVQI